MNLDNCQKTHLVELDEDTQHLIMKICPDLHDFCLYHFSGEYQAVNFYFKDDPQKDEKDYLGFGIEEFVPNSDTHERLTNVLNTACTTLGLSHVCQ